MNAAQRHRIHAFGFSLLELFIVISLCLLLAVFGAPSMARWHEQNSLRSALIGSASLLRQAKSLALAHTKPVVASFFAQGKSWCIGLNEQTACDCRQPASCVVNQQALTFNHQQLSGIRLQSIRFTQQRTQFDAVRALSVGRAGSLEFHSQHYQAKLVLSNFGRLRICSVNHPISGLPLC